MTDAPKPPAEDSALSSAVAEYRRLHARIMDPADREIPKRFVVFPGDFQAVGLANRQLVFLYGVLVGMLTGRAVIGLPFPGADTIYDFPFRCTEADLEERLGIRLRSFSSYETYLRSLETLGYPGWAGARHRACEDYAQLGPPRYLELDGGGIQVYRYQEGFPEPLFAGLNPFTRDRIHGWFGGELLRPLASSIFRLNEDARALLAPYLDEIGAHYTVGVQVRYAYGRMDTFFGSRRNVEVFWRLAEELGSASGDTGWRVLLGTDNAGIRREAERVFGERLIPTATETLPDGDRRAAAFDQALLASCAALVLTERSTFGFLARAIGDVPAVAVDGKSGRVRRRLPGDWGLYARSRWTVPRTWPWQEGALLRTGCGATLPPVPEDGAMAPRNPLWWALNIGGPELLARLHQPVWKRIPPGLKRRIRSSVKLVAARAR